LTLFDNNYFNYQLNHQRKPAKMKLLKLPSATVEIPFPCVVSNAVEKNSWDTETNGTLKFLKIMISLFFFQSWIV